MSEDSPIFDFELRVRFRISDLIGHRIGKRGHRLVLLIGQILRPVRDGKDLRIRHRDAGSRAGGIPGDAPVLLVSGETIRKDGSVFRTGGRRSADEE